MALLPTFSPCKEKQETMVFMSAMTHFFPLGWLNYIVRSVSGFTGQWVEQAGQWVEQAGQWMEQAGQWMEQAGQWVEQAGQWVEWMEKGGQWVDG